MNVSSVNAVVFLLTHNVNFQIKIEKETKNNHSGADKVPFTDSQFY